MRRIVALALLVSLVLAGCESYGYQRVTTTDTGAHHWLYYPDQNLYYCNAHDHYWYLVPAEGRWVQTEKQLPPHIQQVSERYFKIEYAGTNPYQYNQQHIQQYRAGSGK